MRNVEQRLIRIEQLQREILAAILSGQAPPIRLPGDNEYREAIARALDGDRSALDAYLEKSRGIVPKAETIYGRQFRSSRGGKLPQGSMQTGDHVERPSGKPTADRHHAARGRSLSNSSRKAVGGGASPRSQ